MIRSLQLSGVDYGIAEPSDLDDVARMLAQAFSRYDPPAVAAGLTAAEFEDFVRLVFPAAVAGLTIVARSASTGEMAGVLFTDDSATPLPQGMERLSDKFDPIFDLLGQLEADYRHGSPPAPGESLHLFLLGVAQPFGGQGIGQQLVSSCVENGAHRGYRVAVTEATGSVSQHIFRKQGFVDRARRSYRDHRYQGRAVFGSIEGHAGPILMDRPLS
jgi:ribosomal protein S18 acetylase RimI-like enzyme